MPTRSGDRRHQATLEKTVKDQLTLLVNTDLVRIEHEQLQPRVPEVIFALNIFTCDSRQDT